MSNVTDALNESIRVEVVGLLSGYAFSAKTTVSMLSESENKIFLINDPARSENYVARVNSGRLVYHTQEMIDSEMAWLQAIRSDTDVTVPAVLSDNNGTIVHQLHLPLSDTTRFMAVYSFLPGVEPPEGHLDSGFRQLGEVTAQLNLHTRSWEIPEGFQRPTWTAEAILDDTYGWGHWKDGVCVDSDVLSLLIRAETTILHRAEQFPRDRSNFGLIHADLRLANVLVDGDNTAIIDFDDCGFGWYIYELAAALSFLEERPDIQNLIKSWHAGYRKLSEISSDLIEEIPTFLLLRRLKLLGWVGYQQRNLAFAREIGPKFTADTCDLASEYIKRYSHNRPSSR